MWIYKYKNWWRENIINLEKLIINKEGYKLKKTINLPDKDTALFGFRTNLSLSDQRIFLYLLKSAFEQRKGLGANKKDVLQLYITFELGQALGNF